MNRTAKKARQGRKQQERDIAAPSAERRRHGPIEREGTAVKDANGAVGLRFRALTTIDIMLRRGSITPDMFRAGETFHRQFVLAALGPLAAAARTRLPVLLSVWSQNHRAQAFYLKHGFEKIAEFKFPVGETLDDEFLMRLA